jgi:hypothetical protein
MTADQTDRSDLTPVALGLCLVGLGVVLILHNVGVLDAAEALRLWPVALIVLGGVMLYSTVRGGDMRRSGVSVGAVVWVVILGMILSYAFDRRSSASPLPEGHVNVFAVMSGDRQPLAPGQFRGGRMTTVMGGAQLDLRQSTLAPGETAVVDVFTAMGGGVIRVPQDWRVEIEATAVAGGIKDDRPRRTTPKDSERSATETAGDNGTKSGDAGRAEGSAPSQAQTPAAESVEEPAIARPTLIIRGFIVMGGLSIKS